MSHLNTFRAADVRTAFRTARVAGWTRCAHDLSLTDAQAVAYYTANPPGSRYPAAYQCFRGTASKPAAHFAARSLDEAVAKCREWLATEAARVAAKAERKAKERAELAAVDASKSTPVGTVVVHQWGWEQSNVQWYKVVEVLGRRKVRLVEIPGKSVPGSHQPHGMADEVVADLDAEVDPAAEGIVANLQAGGRHFALKHASRYASWGRLASVWDGRPCYRSWYA